MTAVEFADLLAHPNELNTVSYETLDQLLMDYPYCNGLRLLLLKKYKNDKNSAFERHLVLASMYATDRGRLYDYLHTSVVANARTEITEAEAVEDVHPAQESTEVVLVEPPSIYRHKVSENPPILAFQPPLSAEELATQPVEEPATEEREDLSAMPIEEWLQLPAEPNNEAENKDTPTKRSFKLSRIPTFDVNMFDFLDETEQAAEPTPKPTAPVSTPEPIAESHSEPTVEETDVFDFFMQQTNSFLESLTTRKGGAEKPPLPKEIEDQSTDENETIISETLAELLATQGQNAKAIKMYAALSLKFPEKSRFFADKIAALEV